MFSALPYSVWSLVVECMYSTDCAGSEDKTTRKFPEDKGPLSSSRENEEVLGGQYGFFSLQVVENAWFRPEHCTYLQHVSGSKHDIKCKRSQDKTKEDNLQLASNLSIE